MRWMMLLVLLFTAACGNDLDPAGDNPAAAAPANQEEAPIASNEEPLPAEPDEMKNEGPLEDAGHEPTEAQDEEENAETLEKLYRMNDYYLIVPKEEGIEKKVVLLTFDDGPKEEQMVSDMLEVLDKHEAKAIFFVNGFRVEQNPELLLKLYNSGHAIGNHSWDHINLKEVEDAEIDRQVEAVQDKVKELTGEAPLFFRPPHGAGTDYLKHKVAEEGMLYMTWSTSPEDWLKQNQTPEMVITNTLERVHPGANLLMHELPWTVEALDTLLTELKDLGYTFVNPDTIEITSAESSIK